MGVPASIARPRPRQAEIVASDGRLELLFEGGCILTEGVAAAPSGMIYFSDITVTDDCCDERGVQAGHIWRFDPRTGVCSIFRSPSGMANGIVFDRLGRMIVAEGADTGARRITRTEMSSGRSFVIASTFDGRPLNSPNDVAVDALDRVYFTDPRYVGLESIHQPVMGVYRISEPGHVERLITDMRRPNGVAVAPDQDVLYVSESDNGSSHLRALPRDAPLPASAWFIYSYPLRADGSLSGRAVFADLTAVGQPDGLTIDSAGNLYVAIARPDPMVCVFSRRGEWLAAIALPAQATNVEFGRGEQSHLLYITAGRGLYRISLLTKGFQFPAVARSQ